MNVPSQATLWNGPAAQAWIDAQETIDQLFQPLEALLVETLAAQNAAKRVLDVGCGTGGTTLALARVPGRDRDCVGIDVSAPMLAVARARAERAGLPASFVCADAENHTFTPASFDLIVSRFGVMFFGDPARAFANLRRAAAPHAAMRCIVWRSAAENPFMTTAERAAAPLLPDLPARPVDGPGQFSFADASRVREILERSDWQDIDIQPIDVTCRMPEPALSTYVARLGPVGIALREVDESTRSEVLRTVRAAFAPFVEGAEVQFQAACWLLNARAR